VPVVSSGFAAGRATEEGEREAKVMMQRMLLRTDFSYGRLMPIFLTLNHLDGRGSRDKVGAQMRSSSSSSVIHTGERTTSVRERNDLVRKPPPATAPEGGFSFPSFEKERSEMDKLHLNVGTIGHVDPRQDGPSPAPSRR